MRQDYPALHGQQHRPVGFNGPADPGGPDPIPWSAFANHPWCRVRQWNNGTDQNISSGTMTTMLFNDSVGSPDTADFFTPHTDNTILGQNSIVVLVDGLYSIRARFAWNDAPAPTPTAIALQGIDTDDFFPYVNTVDFVDITETGFAATLARLAANQIIYVTVRQDSGSTKHLYGSGGNFLEIQLIGNSTVTDIDGGP